MITVGWLTLFAVYGFLASLFAVMAAEDAADKGVEVPAEDYLLAACWPLLVVIGLPVYLWQWWGKRRG